MQLFQNSIDTLKGLTKQHPKLYAYFWGLPLYRKVMSCVNNRLTHHVNRKGRQEFIGDCCRKKYYAKLNDLSDTDCLRNKRLAYEEFKEYYGRQASVFYISEGFERFCEIVKAYGTAMVKPSDASGGYGITKVTHNDRTALQECFDTLSSVSPSGEIFIEEYVQQAPELKVLHPSSLNTARVITILDYDGNPHILGAFFRVGTGGKVVDNGASGGILCKLNNNGTIVRCMNKDGSEFTTHPDTEHPLVGFTIPEWDSAKQLAKALAKKKPSIRFCGWDLALSDKGWIMIEGNESSEFIGIQIFGDGCKDRITKYL